MASSNILSRAHSSEDFSLKQSFHAQAHAVGLYLIWSGFENRADNGLCIFTDKLSFLDKEESIDTYSCGKIIDALNKNRIQTWDGVNKSVPDEKRYMNISIWDSVDDKTVTACGNSVPENYDAARDELVRAIIEFYEERTKSE